MKNTEILQVHADALKRFLPEIEALEDIDELKQLCNEAIARNYFRPGEEQHLQSWFSNLLSIRKQLWISIYDIQSYLDDDYKEITVEQWPFFVVAYCAICLLVRLDFLLINQVATHSIVQRKLNEPVKSSRIPARQYTEIYRSLASIRNAWRMNEIMHLADANKKRFAHLEPHPVVADFTDNLHQFESVLDPSKRNFLYLYLSYRAHSLRRRLVKTFQNGFFWLLELGGRLAAEIHYTWAKKGVTDEIRDHIAALLHPGDILVTRHRDAFTNLFLPGFWPHAALYTGPCPKDDSMNLTEEIREHWQGSRCVLEALKDGVHFRPLHQTLKVDAFVVLRPQLHKDDVRKGIEKVARHAGKHYNFDFDFFSSDRLVCTEVIYRAFDGIGKFKIDLQVRAGRPTLSADDLVRMAVETGMAEPVACFGFRGCYKKIEVGENVLRLLKKLPGP